MGYPCRIPENGRAPLVVFLVLCLTLTPLLSASAQAGATAALGALTIDAFPRISAYLDVRDAAGNFVSGLQESNLNILEDGVSLPAAEVNELSPGAQFAIAISPGRDFALRDGNGISRYDLISAAIRSWANAHLDSANDDLSLFMAGGEQVIHTKTAADAIPALETITKDVRSTEPTPDVLFSALETVLDSTPRPGMGRGVLFITTPLASTYDDGLQDMARRARELGVRVHVWLVATPEYFAELGNGLLGDIAQQTGGLFFGFTGVETFPDPETYLIPLRKIYSISYDSLANTTGIHQVSIEVKMGDLQASTPPHPLDLTIEPPNPMLVSAPQHILRQEVEVDNEGSTTIKPNLQNLEVLVEFPDNLPRPLLTTTLFVDGTPIATVQGNPVGSFSWDLGQYITSSEHLLRIETVDSLGLRGSSIDIPVSITVQRLPVNLLKSLSRHATALTALAGLLVVAILGLVLILRGRIRPHQPGTPALVNASGQNYTAKSRHGKKVIDPLVQPVEIKTEAPAEHTPGWLQKLPWPQKNTAPKPVAFLTPVIPDESGAQQSPIPISAEEIVLGRDPRLANFMVDDPSVESIHARLVRVGETYRISDDGSVAGTWVNYTPVSNEGTRLEHGDLVHIGTAGYRFTLYQPSRVLKTIISSEDSSR